MTALKSGFFLRLVNRFITDAHKKASLMLAFQSLASGTYSSSAARLVSCAISETRAFCWRWAS